MSDNLIISILFPFLPLLRFRLSLILCPHCDELDNGARDEIEFEQLCRREKIN
jgi:hypothetical protein